MSFARRNAVPFAAGLAAAAAAFAVVLLTTDVGGEGRAAGSTGPIGPNLDERLPNHTRESLTAQILSPDPDGFMPGDFGERMTDAELTALVDFLLAVRDPR
jgi:hypothetical protein